MINLLRMITDFGNMIVEAETIAKILDDAASIDEGRERLQQFLNKLKPLLRSYGEAFPIQGHAAEVLQDGITGSLAAIARAQASEDWKLVSHTLTISLMSWLRICRLILEKKQEEQTAGAATP